MGRNKKRKNSNDVSQNFSKKKRLEKQEEKKKVLAQDNCNEEVKKEQLLPSIQNFFQENVTIKSENESSDDEVVTVKIEKTKKKKLTNVERKFILRVEEERLRKVEQENFDASTEPQTVEQFEKYLKGDPNNSKMWAKYIAHLVFVKEIEKAKSVAREAIESISISLTKERYNIWIVLLNLENSYGDKNSFEEVFQEAIKRNEDLNIYLDTINILYLSGKHSEMEEKISKARKKFKQNLKMYFKIAEIYYQMKKFPEARNIRVAALKTMDKKLAISATVKFAIMEFQMGEKDQGEVLFENILQFYPSKVDIWSTYVDQLVKVKDIEVARRILNRAVTQNLPPKKAKVLFNKFKRFEMENGDENTLKHVITLAENYVKSK